MSSRTTELPSTDIQTFKDHLARSKRIVALLGAGISAASGLPTFRGAGGLWRSYSAVNLATPMAFNKDPSLVWYFYSHRRHMALNAKPNRAHLALAELARRNSQFITLSQNVDGLSPRAGHPEGQLKLLHGSLFDIKCENDYCGFMRKNDFTDPIVPALKMPENEQEAKEMLARAKPTSQQNQASTQQNPMQNLLREIETTPQALRDDGGGTRLAGDKDRKQTVASLSGINIGDPSVPLPTLSKDELPQCPKCKTHLLRPGVVWFGEELPSNVMEDVHDYFHDPAKIDLCIVIGTSATVYPAAGYAEFARSKGARIAVVNLENTEENRLTERDWFFEGDAAQIVPELLRDIIGEVGEFPDNTTRITEKPS